MYSWKYVIIFSLVIVLALGAGFWYALTHIIAPATTIDYGVGESLVQEQEKSPEQIREDEIVARISELPNVDESTIRDGFYALVVENNADQPFAERDNLVLREVTLSEIVERTDYAEYVDYLYEVLQNGILLGNDLDQRYIADPSQLVDDWQNGRLDVETLHPGLDLLARIESTPTYEGRLRLVENTLQELDSKDQLDSGDLRQYVVLDSLYYRWSARDEAAELLCRLDTIYCDTRKVTITLAGVDNQDVEVVSHGRPNVLVDGSVITVQAYPTEIITLTVNAKDGTETSGPLYVETLLNSNQEQEVELDVTMVTL